MTNLVSAFAVGDAFGLLFQTTFDPDLVHTNSAPDCLKVAPSGEQESPFLIGAAHDDEVFNTRKGIRRVKTRELTKPTRR
jgi:hypothetical protein